MISLSSQKHFFLAQKKIMSDKIDFTTIK